MAKLVSVFISERHRRLISFAIWVLSFAMALAAMGWYATEQARSTMRLETSSIADHFIGLREDLQTTFNALHTGVTAAPCSVEFGEQLQKVAYLPDGLSEFVYAPGGVARCSSSVSYFPQAVDFGEPDIPRQSPSGLAFWMDRDLDVLGLDGLKGTIALQEPFAVVVPPQKIDLSQPQWLAIEVAFVARDGAWWHRGGTPGVYASASEAEVSGNSLPFSRAIRQLTCDPLGMHCIAAEADVLALLRTSPGAVILALLAAAAVAAGITTQINRMITHYWSFEQRLCRHLDTRSVICAYQPIMDLRTGQIAGCEVLTRWRDVDDGIVYPDRFIGIIERRRLTLHFTEMVARRAYAELSEGLPSNRRLQINFNIFPQDLDGASLARVFEPFTAEPERFEVVLEIIESDEIPATAQREIEALRSAGIKTYIDDFGTGYSNMQNLAALSVDGVKLDRSFAMAPDNSMMARMLTYAVDMIQATGRVMVVEGVETAARLELLRNMKARIDFVQGYFISRPLDIASFAEFLSSRTIPLAGRRRKVA